MAFYIKNAISAPTLIAITDAISDRALFEDGKISAGPLASSVKSNLQAKEASPAIVGATKLIEEALLTNKLVNTSSYPKKFAKTMFSRYEAGMHYGEHIDEAFINNTRTDLAFTVFLSDPSDYDGGELEISKSDGRDTIKLAAGDAYIYPADTIHQVLPVISGVRLAAIGWIQSKVRTQQQREILFDLSSAISALPEGPDSAQARLKILKVRSNLQRLWCD